LRRRLKGAISQAVSNKHNSVFQTPIRASGRCLLSLPHKSSTYNWVRRTYRYDLVWAQSLRTFTTPLTDVDEDLSGTAAPWASTMERDTARPIPSHPIYLRSNKSIKDSFLVGNSWSIVYHLNEHLILIRRGCSNDYVRRNLATSNASIAFEIKMDEHLYLRC
jgi:hypothetical protein